MALEEEKLQAFSRKDLVARICRQAGGAAAETAACARHQCPEAALVYAPLFHYRLVVVSAGGRERTKTATYDPIANLCALD